MNDLANTNTDFNPTNFDQLKQFADLVSKSGMVPKVYSNNAPNVLVAVMMGAEVGLKPLQALQNIAVINGTPSMWGDAVLAIVKNSKQFESIKETFNEDKTIATCVVKRKGEELVTRTFGKTEAETAGLLSKDNYKKYPSRMYQLRARAWALRDVFPDVLKGMQITEEVEDTNIEVISTIDIEQINSTLKPLSLSAYESNGKIIVNGNSYGKADILKQLGFTYEDKKWFINLPDSKEELLQEPSNEGKKVQAVEKLENKTPSAKKLEKKTVTLKLEEKITQKSEEKNSTKVKPVKKSKKEDTVVIENIETITSSMVELRKFLKSNNLIFKEEVNGLSKWLFIETKDIEKIKETLREIGFKMYATSGLSLDVTNYVEIQEVKTVPLSLEDEIPFT